MLVLVRKRGAAFEAVIRALKSAGVPVAGADRLDIGEHIAVARSRGGRAARRCCREDDLTLATALKSPLVGLTDDDLTRIAARRDGAESLHQALPSPCRRERRGGAARLRRASDLARSSRGCTARSASSRPCSGRSAAAAKLVARLGSEAGDADRRLPVRRASTRRRRETPSLTTFLTRFESASHDDRSATSMPAATRCG